MIPIIWGKYKAIGEHKNNWMSWLEEIQQWTEEIQGIFKTVKHTAYEREYVYVCVCQQNT